MAPLDIVQRNIRILALSKEHASLKAFAAAAGGSRPYDWWRSLSKGSRAEFIQEAAKVLNVSVDALMSENASGLFKPGERVTLHG
jgi:hypothetical protein